MMEEEWLASKDVGEMVEHIEGFVSERKARLLGCACVAWAWTWGLNESVPEAVRIAEAFADGLATAEELDRVSDEMESIWHNHEERYRPYPRTCYLTALLDSANNLDALHELGAFASDMGIDDDPEWFKVTAFVHDIIGNPFRPVACEPSWLTSDVLALARGIYDEKAFDRMPILADALQDAGCTNDDILNHCREASQVHVRGCWIVDSLLGKG